VVVRDRRLGSAPVSGDLHGVLDQEGPEAASESWGPPIALRGIQRRVEQRRQERATKAPGLLVDLLLRSLDEDVRGADLVTVDVTVARAEREVPVP
jgi:hypothetical protein